MESAKKILLVQLYSNGDCLYATAVARQIKQDFPGCHLTWAISVSCKKFIDGNPDADAVLVVTEVKRDNEKAFKKLRRRFFSEKKKGQWDEVFVTHTMGANQALYDGTVRGMIFRAYPNPVTVPVQPTPPIQTS